MKTAPFVSAANAAALLSCAIFGSVAPQRANAQTDAALVERV